MTLTSHHLELSATATTPLALDDQAGSAIRGAVVGGLLEQFCTNKDAPSCAACPFSAPGINQHPLCAVAALIAPMREEGEPGGTQRPRPYVIRPPLADSARTYAPGETLTFGLTLLGPTAQLFPYIFMAAQAIERNGLGRRMAANNGRRGGLHIMAISAVHMLRDERQLLYQRGHQQVQAPGLPVTPEDVRAAAAALPSERLTLHFHTPLRLVEDKRLVHRFEPRPFFARLARRLDELARAYGGGQPISDYLALPDYITRIQVAADETRWIDVVSYSARTRSSTPIGGLVGSVTLAGELAPLRELLVWGSLLHVGKNAVKGDGWYSIGTGSPGEGAHDALDR